MGLSIAGTDSWGWVAFIVALSPFILGSFVVNELRKKGVKNITIPSSKDCDLIERSNCKSAVKNIDIVFHLAAKVGGIGLNQEKPGELFYDNLMMGTQLMHEANEAGVEKFIALGTNDCAQAKHRTVPSHSRG